MNIKRAVIFLIPIFTGAIATYIFLEAKETKSKIENLTPIISANQDTFSIKQTAPKKIEDFIVESQAILAKATEISKDNKNNETMHQTNEKIVEFINQAIETASMAVFYYPADPRGWAQRAKIYETIKDYLPNATETAIANWQKAIKLDSTNSDYCQKLANIYLSNGRNAEAVFYLDMAANANPSSVELLKALAQQQTKSGMILQSRKTYQKIIALTTSKEQRKEIEDEILSLDELLAQTNSSQIEPESYFTPEEITLPDNPPLLEARHLAGGPIIAAPQEENSKHEIRDMKYETNALSGEAVIPAGQTEIEICNDNLSPEAQVYLTAEGEEKNIILAVKRKVPYNPETGKCSYFVAVIAEPIIADLPFRWWIIN